MSPIVQRVKHFKKDPFLPFPISIFGFSDLDFLDLYFGMLDGSLNKDVRKDLLLCYNNESILQLLLAAVTNIFGLISGFFAHEF